VGKEIMTSTSTLPARAYQFLGERFGHQTFRPGQEAIIQALLQGKHVLTVMPTGSGKSLCYQLPALLHEGNTLVVSPLIALMKDQVDALQARGIAATFINSSLAASEQQERLYAYRAGHYKLLYVAPERFRNTRFLHAMAETPVSLFAVDEAHCISQWGHDFRPDYLRLREAIAHLAAPQVLALTATATVEVQDDIVRQLGCADMQRFVTGFDRANLIYRVLSLRGHAAKLQVLGEVIDAQEHGSTIIYAATRRAVEDIASFLHERGTEALIYHAGLRDTERQRTQEAFMQEKCRLMVATNAFGMGVDKPDVRCVLHFNLPRSLEAYYQEAGRAGRDGLPAECILLFSHGDVRIQEFLLEQTYPPREVWQEVYGAIVQLSSQYPDVSLRALLPYCRRGTHEMQVLSCAKLLERAGYLERVAVYDSTEELTAGMPSTLVRLTGEESTPRQLVIDEQALEQRKQHELQKLRRMLGYAQTKTCRRQKILAYFGEHCERQQCAGCDNCLADRAFDRRAQLPTRLPTDTEATTIQKILSCVARMRGYYGRAKVVQVLLGSQASEIVQSHLSQLSTYGLLKGMPRLLLNAYLDALLEATCIQVVGDEFPKLDLTPLGYAVMRRQQRVPLALPESTPVPPSALPSLTPEVIGPPQSTPPTPTCDEPLFERLRAHRLHLAQVESLPPYCVFNDRSLREMATHHPTTPDSFLQIYGVGAIKASKYGDTFLALIRDYLASNQADL
jgi:ATP-dependent DNA helicase RecQ